jgi:2-phosphoglycerate kinase
MIYLVGGSPRVGKTILGQQIAAKLHIGWISTDILMTLLGMTNVEGIKTEWNAAPEALAANAEWFFPYLERFIWGVNSMAEQYVIEGVDFLPAQVVQLSTQYHIRSVFLGCSSMTLERLDQFPGRSRGYSGLPEGMRRQIAQDVPAMSEFFRQEAERFGYPYLDMVSDFPQRLHEAEAMLTSGG